MYNYVSVLLVLMLVIQLAKPKIQKTCAVILVIMLIEVT